MGAKPVPVANRIIGCVSSSFRVNVPIGPRTRMMVFFFNQRVVAEQHAAEQAAVAFADVQFELFCLRGAAGEGVAAGVSVFQQDVYVLAGEEDERRFFRHVEFEDGGVVQVFH